MNVSNEMIMNHFKEYYPSIYWGKEIDDQVISFYLKALVAYIETIRDLEADVFLYNEPGPEISWKYLRSIQTINLQLVKKLDQITKEK